MPYWQIFYHIVWATKYREEVLTPEVELIINQLIRQKAIALGGALFALNGWVDHRHIIATFPPKIGVAYFVGQLKGFSSAMFNKSGHPAAPIFWQDEYSVFSIDKRSLQYHIAYVERQKEHHSQGMTISILERVGGNGVQKIREDEEQPQT